MSKTNHGTVEVTLGDEVFTLKPTLKAMKAIEGRFGGILPAMQSVGTANLSTIPRLAGRLAEKTGSHVETQPAQGRQ